MALAWLVLIGIAHRPACRLPVSALRQRSGQAVAAMDWGVLIPLWFMGRADTSSAARRRPPRPGTSIREGQSARSAIAEAARCLRPAGPRSSPAPTTPSLTITRGPYGYERRRERSMTSSYAGLCASRVRKRLLMFPLRDGRGTAKADSLVGRCSCLHAADREGVECAACLL